MAELCLPVGMTRNTCRTAGWRTLCRQVRCRGAYLGGHAGGQAGLGRGRGNADRLDYTAVVELPQEFASAVRCCDVAERPAAARGNVRCPQIRSQGLGQLHVAVAR